MADEVKKLTIHAIKTSKGYYISSPNTQNNYYGHDGLFDYLFDGAKPQPSFHSHWGIIPNMPAKISRMIKQPKINNRFVLVDESLACEKIPMEIKREDAGGFGEDDNYTFIWNDQYAIYQSLYKEVSDEQPDKEENYEFEFIVLFEVGDIVPPPEFNYPVNQRWYDRQLHDDYFKNDKIIHQELDKIIFPDIFIHETPCKLSSEDTYKIVREHVKHNINLKVARITSDYDFCFEVAKIVPLAKPYNHTYDDNIGTNKKKKILTKLISTKEIKCFEMTNNEDNYKGYTPISGFEGKTEADLKFQIDAYLADLMKYINEPLKECPHCDGRGVLFNSEVEPVTIKH